LLKDHAEPDYGQRYLPTIVSGTIVWVFGTRHPPDSTLEGICRSMDMVIIAVPEIQADHMMVKTDTLVGSCGD
jgi:hypothetical protein